MDDFVVSLIIGFIFVSSCSSSTSGDVRRAKEEIIQKIEQTCGKPNVKG